MDGFTACPASGEGTAQSTDQVFGSSIWSRLNDVTVPSLYALWASYSEGLDSADGQL